MSDLTPADRELIEAALQARARAYAPYSSFPVGAALRDHDGVVHTGVNVENASLGLSICAERNAVFAAVAAGARAFEAVAIVAGDGTPTPPCGACRQVLGEFAADLRVLLATPSGTVVVHRLSELQPFPFRTFRGEEGLR
jgi:cytidine deaminase